ncbi:myosin-7B-like [Cucurbita pepo subsp. pepo]|uniref:myosin-7B-like n=1 Tax=Cucurbita pepo subsp. pepo TaxID=3664 RepID=UPI000C9D8FA5|nr:myosin-7B-like [Cucurbita pepo subsp. pepo]XP_023552512.1 myosin-7B-like [Cucurbita pepo subsp. pepo]XP_023552513.1 myosin-7B-like [Cucurbita pepo subsp. pepo]XP_023552514.1 myosin-7B-like [Cucurbita pepo subsp. pepo]XP_023552515.1 myosin-7B-like [Cucurbita pepo subsp. pepo]XP_023552516.1 myosin-7B-like [Cucurbita pepo subsp. pepo]XP_023552517.1 myosin-7B-like [Cucurbita pepo subsp. pepo]XP_023552518.1 myosin-7B-like [Cucurbita pepo subsp. pepo]XP_023552521.1 myosin-7B-like [Cucurbita pe
MMDKKEVSNSLAFISDDKIDSLSPMYFGASCAFFALRLLATSDCKDEKWSEVREKMLQGSAQLLGLLLWSAQREVDARQKPNLVYKLEAAEREIGELKRIRHEDAKANEKVVCIFAAQEQRWLIERKTLRQHIGALMDDARLLEKKEVVISTLNEKLKEMEMSLESKEKKLEEEIKRGADLEERLSKAESVVEELRETAKREAQEHSSELWKHKTAFIELVSNQRQLEAEMGRAVRQVEASKEEIDSILEQKEESVMLVQKLSGEIVKMRKDLEQKDKMLSAMLRKSKMDVAQKAMLLKEVKLSKARRKQAELEAERWKTISESRHERQSLRSMLSNQVNSGYDVPTSAGEKHSNTNNGKTISTKPNDTDIDYYHPESIDSNNFPFLAECLSPERNDDSGRMIDVKQMEELVCSEAEKYVLILQQRHDLEIDAFAEQMGVKDEKLEVFHWQMLNLELESKRLQSHLAAQNQEILQLRHANMKLKALSMETEKELASLKAQLAAKFRPQEYQPTKWDLPDENSGTWSDVKTIKIKPGEEEQQRNKECNGTIREAACLNVVEDRNPLMQSPGTEFEDEKEIGCHSPTQEVSTSSPQEADNAEPLASIGQQFGRTYNSTQWRMDIHALGVSFKIKRLKQQFLLLERLIGKQETARNSENEENGEDGIRGFLMFLTLLNKQVGRYNSLQEKTDELCQRMHDYEASVKCGEFKVVRTKGKSKALENFLEQTFQLQRYVVLTGQKWMEIQVKISVEFGKVAEELHQESGSFDIKRFASTVKTLFQEVQRGLEVRITRIIGDLEGTLACEGMNRLSR